MSTIDRIFVLGLACLAAIGVAMLGDLHDQLKELAVKLSIADDRLTQLDIVTTAHDADIRHLTQAVYQGGLP
jgi:hypothetical protein